MIPLNSNSVLVLCGLIIAAPVGSQGARLDFLRPWAQVTTRFAEFRCRNLPEPAIIRGTP
ncbi:hypothetical protein I553_1095 [Mycobacterium xenopi 4042]|uniref:Uncharacterized protein n=1 Tax=Mycobacterium xenopi 4042 TaxID=1299334 RepID=X7ZC03_MYCXE|nr:hypothetical protein I553_1095 [Mycobacterium xenopi 4042]